MTTVGHITGDTMKEETMKDLEEVYRKASAMNLSPAEHAEVNKLIVSTFQAGADWALFVVPLEGYSNLTSAIKADDPIDWEKLDGLKVKCVKSDVHTLQGELKRFSHYYPFTTNAWWDDDEDPVYVSAFKKAWNGEDGWTLWIEGEIPLRRKTADQLEIGTYFRGEITGYMEGEAYVGGEEFGIGKRVHRAPSMIESTVPASEWTVLEEYGTSPKPEDK